MTHRDHHTPKVRENGNGSVIHGAQRLSDQDKEPKEGGESESSNEFDRGGLGIKTRRVEERI